jgi:hypothetical protein
MSSRTHLGGRANRRMESFSLESIIREQKKKSNDVENIKKLVILEELRQTKDNLNEDITHAVDKKSKKRKRKRKEGIEFSLQHR